VLTPSLNIYFEKHNTLYASSVSSAGTEMHARWYNSYGPGDFVLDSNEVVSASPFEYFALLSPARLPEEQKK